MGIYTIIEGIDNSTIFKFMVVLLISFVFFKNKNIGLNIILSIFIAGLFIAYSYDKLETTIELEEKQKEVKRDSIQPKPTDFEDKDDVIDFLFSIQDFYHYNPQVYEEMINNLTDFFVLYRAIYRKSKYCEQYYQIAENKKNNALNALQSMIFTIPTDPAVTDKFDRAHERLETIMNYYLNQIYDVCYRDLLENGRNIHTVAINTGPKAHNHYFDKDYTYQFY